MVTRQDTAPLTASAIKALEPRGEADQSAIPVAPAFGSASSPAAAKVFRWYTTDQGHRVVVTVGAWAERGDADHLTLAEAHRRMATLRTARGEGRLEAARRHQEAAIEGPTVAEVAKVYFERQQQRCKTGGEVVRALKADALPLIGAMKVRAVTPLDVRRVVEAVVSRGSPSAADHLFNYLKALLRFAVGRGDLDRNPADVLDPDTLGAERTKRQRILTDREVAQFWAALDRSPMAAATRAALRLLLFTGVRSGELLRATWPEFDLPAAVWTVPPDHQKTNLRQRAPARPWRVPLSKQALIQVEKLRVLSEGSTSPYVMASPLAEGGSTTLKALDHAMRRLFIGARPLLAFAEPRPTPHDLRRTVRTNLGRMGVPPHIAERCLNHTLGTIETTYDTHDYFTERAEALARWGAHVAGLVEASSNVVPLGAAGLP